MSCSDWSQVFVGRKVHRYSVASPDKDKKKRVTTEVVWREARELVWAHRGKLAVGMLLMVVNRLAGLVLPTSSKFLIDRVLPLLLACLCASCGYTTSIGTGLTELQRVQSGNIEVVLLAPTDALKQTRNYATLAFRTGTDRHLVDVGMVKVRTTMTMEGQPMDGYVTEVNRVDTGRYEVQMVMAMTGTWRIGVDWDGAAGPGSAMFEAVVR